MRVNRLVMKVVSVAQRIACWICNPEVAGSYFARHDIFPYFFQGGALPLGQKMGKWGKM